MNILIVADHFDWIRDLQLPFNLLARRGHRVHVLADGGNLPRNQRVGASNAVEFAFTPGREQAPWAALSAALRDSLSSGGRAARSPRLAALAGRLEREVPTDRIIGEYLDRLAPSVLVLIPFFAPGSTQVTYLRAAKALGIPTLVYSGRWLEPSITHAGPDAPDCIAVFSAAQRRLLTARGFVPDSVAVVGSLRADWLLERGSRHTDDYVRRTGLDPLHKTILYASLDFSDVSAEFGRFQQWLTVIRGAGPTVATANVIVSCSPEQALPWRSVVKANGLSRVAVVSHLSDPRHGAAEDGYVDALSNADVAVSASVSGLADAALLKRPVGLIGPECFGEPSPQASREPAEAATWVHRSGDLEGHIAWLTSQLSTVHVPDSASESFRRELRPHGDEIPVGLVLSVILEELGKTGVPPVKLPALPRTARAVLYPIAKASARLVPAHGHIRRRSEARAAPSTVPRRVLIMIPTSDQLEYYEPLVPAFTAGGHTLTFLYTPLAGTKLRRPLGSKRLRASATVIGLPPFQRRFWDAMSQTVLAFRRSVRMLLVPETQETAEARTWLKRGLPRAFRQLAGAGTIERRQGERWLSLLRRCDRAIPANGSLKRFLADGRYEVVVASTPFCESSVQPDILRAARELGLRTALVVTESDGLEAPTIAEEVSDAVIVWNARQQKEATERHRVPVERAVIAGVPKSEQWIRDSRAAAPVDIRPRVGLSPKKPYVVFVGSASHRRGQADDERTVRQWLDSMSQAPEPWQAMSLLVKPSADHVSAWRSSPLVTEGHVVIWPSGRDRFSEPAVRKVTAEVGSPGTELEFAL